MSFLEPPWSVNYKRWELANITSFETAELIQKHGQETFTNPKLGEMRLETRDKLREAYPSTNKIDLEYLKASHAELPFMYRKHFVNALSLWHEGFSSKTQRRSLKEFIATMNFCSGCRVRNNQTLSNLDETISHQDRASSFNKKYTTGVVTMTQFNGLQLASLWLEWSHFFSKTLKKYKLTQI